MKAEPAGELDRTKRRARQVTRNVSNKKFKSRSMETPDNEGLWSWGRTKLIGCNNFVKCHFRPFF
jgi:hypothetical protein